MTEPVRPLANFTRRVLLAVAAVSIVGGLATASFAEAADTAWLSVTSAALLLAHATTAYLLRRPRPAAYLKPVTLVLASAQCLAFVFSEGLGAVQLTPLSSSLVVWLVMYNEPRQLRLIGGVHLGAAVLLLWLAPGIKTEVTWLTHVAFALMTAGLATASVLTVLSNRSHHDRMTRYELELRRKERSLRQTAAQLTAQRDELSVAAHALGEAIATNAPQLEALRLAYEEQAQIATAASSDLRQPLRNINQFVQLIRRRLERLGVAEAVSDYLDFVTDGAARMNGMVDDLLRYSDHRVGSDPEPVDTVAVLAGIRDNLRDLLAREGATLDFPDDLPVVIGHRTQVLQLFQNLISNGVKFKRPGVAPRCEVACVVEDGTACFRVSDNGIGIPARRLADVFGLFTRLHERGAYEGTGIGLATCRRIVLAAGGEIWAESTEGEGTTFCFTWPLEEGPIRQAQDRLAPKPATTAAPERVLA